MEENEHFRYILLLEVNRASDATRTICEVYGKYNKEMVLSFQGGSFYENDFPRSKDRLND